mgnify:FL=1
MNATQFRLTCLALTASALLLGLVVLVQLGDKQVELTRTAHAEMVINLQRFTVMTAQSRPGEEALFVLDNNTENLLIYQTDLPNNQIRLARKENLAAAFGGRPAGGGGAGGGVRP